MFCCFAMGSVHEKYTIPNNLTEVMNDPVAFSSFQNYCKRTFRNENLVFWLRVESYKEISSEEERTQEALTIYNTFLSKIAPIPLNLSAVQTTHIRLFFETYMETMQKEAEKEEKTKLKPLHVKSQLRLQSQLPWVKTSKDIAGVKKTTSSHARKLFESSSSRSHKSRAKVSPAPPAAADSNSVLSSISSSIQTQNFAEHKMEKPKNRFASNVKKRFITPTRDHLLEKALDEHNKLEQEQLEAWKFEKSRIERLIVREEFRQNNSEKKLSRRRKSIAVVLQRRKRKVSGGDINAPTEKIDLSQLRKKLAAHEVCLQKWKRKKEIRKATRDSIIRMRSSIQDEFANPSRVSQYMTSIDSIIAKQAGKTEVRTEKNLSDTIDQLQKEVNHDDTKSEENENEDQEQEEVRKLEPFAALPPPLEDNEKIDLSTTFSTSPQIYRFRSRRESTEDIRIRLKLEKAFSGSEEMCSGLYHMNVNTFEFPATLFNNIQQSVWDLMRTGVFNDFIRHSDESRGKNKRIGRHTKKKDKQGKFLESFPGTGTTRDSLGLTF